MIVNHEKFSLKGVSLLRRKDTRINMLHAVTVGVFEDVYSGTITDLSFGGAFIELKEWVDVGVDIQVTLQHKGQNVTTEAQVVHQSNNGIGIGVYFIKPDEKFIAAICDLISNYLNPDYSNGLDFDWVPGRIALYTHHQGKFNVMFTTALGPERVWALVQDTEEWTDSITVTLSERGLFDCQAIVEWRTEQAVGLKFALGSEAFYSAYSRVRISLLDYD